MCSVCTITWSQACSSQLAPVAADAWLAPIAARRAHRSRCPARARRTHRSLQLAPVASVASVGVAAGTTPAARAAR